MDGGGSSVDGKLLMMSQEKNMTVSRESVDETEIRRDPSKVGASVASSDFS